MTWREKFNNMAMIDILYMLSDGTIRTYGVCIKEILSPRITIEKCDLDCRKCMENLLNEEYRPNDIHKQS
jgi:hypothetical protein